MPFEFIQIPANGQGNAKEELNKLLRGGRIASVRKEFVSNGEDSTPAGHNPDGVGLDGVDVTQGSAAARCNPGLWDAMPLALNMDVLLSQRDCVPKPKVGLRHEGLPWDLDYPIIFNPNGVVSWATNCYLLAGHFNCHAPIKGQNHSVESTQAPSQT